MVLDSSDVNDALLLVPYGVYILTTASGEQLNACTASWLTQVSFEPPLIAVAIENESYTRGLLTNGTPFAINFLDSNQIAAANRLALPHRLRPQNLAGLSYRLNDAGAPILEDALGYLACKVENWLAAGDHTIFLGRVTEGAVTRHAELLTLRSSGLRYR